MRTFVFMVWLVCVAALAAAQPVEKNLSILSRSGQFTVQGPRDVLPSPAYLNNPIAATNFLRLDQARLAVMCDRIKLATLRTLGMTDHWKARVYMFIRPSGGLGEAVTIRAQAIEQGWVYRVEVPSEIEPARLIRVLVEVVLQEISSRQTGASQVELPPWLAPGLSARLMTITGMTLVFQPDSRVSRDMKQLDEFRIIREGLNNRTPLTFDELNWPTDDQLLEPPDGFYARCAQLFVHHLLKLRNGQANLQGVLRESGRCLNWQTAFLKGYGAQFPNLRETEKWWALQLVNFRGRTAFHTWNESESWIKLDDILRVGAQVQSRTNQAPDRFETKLQQVISNWDYAQQKSVLRGKVTQLRALQKRIAPELARLLYDYTNALDEYLRMRERATLGSARNPAAENIRFAIQETNERLNILDTIRADMKNALGSARAF